MSAALMQMCVESISLQKYIFNLSRKIHSVYPRLLDVSDAENELWEAVFKAVKDRFKDDRPLIKFARQVCFSRFGTMIGRGNKKRLWSETLDYFTYGDNACIDQSFNRIDMMFTLDQIEDDLKAYAKQSRQYQLAVRTFRCLRKGLTMKACREKLKIKKTHSYHLRDLIRNMSRKYNDEVHN